MDININVKIDCPNIVNAVLALSEALEQMKAEVQINAGFQSQPKEVQAIKENLQNNEKSKIPTLEEVRSFLAKLSQKGKQKEVKS
ncbi:rRNA biogenesis protein rrp5 [Clostridium neuense]|uniref:rRNA biogenesis protein rrp5 n=1 Tax=Clostridium neuense TaxID=1728934 RepID=A0ABW8TC37_9CLOT